ncbi:ribosome recycling factor family protein [Candidatus Phytoplasma oryzae]|uniref:Ribosome recycling factor n=1 Tax=Candidatus Phytoplasma oryzae TaxID=203274 RepID=A0A139JR56_9MOLU|nr:ribosome-recycling factor [Candidatus Phytoplasma oryzae]KXT29432.1 ribosome recycling factor family protein [Candidatus Phytoplasma oryzae]RAM58013.1 ribosome recycling factor [Candidatus Phytoplasma oryzae]
MEDLAKNILDKLETKMLKNHKTMLEKFSIIRTGVANPQILDKIKIMYYNEEILLKNLSTINVEQGNQINIKPFDSSLIPEITKVLLSSKLGITPQNNGVIIKLIFPQPTEEERLKLVKEIKKIAEQVKVSIRQLRKLGNDEIKKLKLNNFLENSFLEKIQEFHNKWIDNVEIEKNKKNKELLKV